VLIAHNPISVKQARYLRKNSTIAEKKLWSRLRNKKVAGLKFRRQQSIGNRIVDFFCKEANLAIELDGSGHSRHCGEVTDLDKEIELYESGVRILRFRNSEVLSNLDGVIDAIIYRIDSEKSLWPPGRVGGLTSE
jgi:very-short-patch-repair endonuclease